MCPPQLLELGHTFFRSINITNIKKIYWYMNTHASLKWYNFSWSFETNCPIHVQDTSKDPNIICFEVLRNVEFLALDMYDEIKMISIDSIQSVACQNPNQNITLTMVKSKSSHMRNEISIWLIICGNTQMLNTKGCHIIHFCI